MTAQTASTPVQRYRAAILADAEDALLQLDNLSSKTFEDVFEYVCGCVSGDGWYYTFEADAERSVRSIMGTRLYREFKNTYVDADTFKTWDYTEKDGSFRWWYCSNYCHDEVLGMFNLLCRHEKKLLDIPDIDPELD